MYVEDLVKLVNDSGVYFEFIRKESNASLGFFKKGLYNKQFDLYIVINLNVKYIDGKRLLEIYI